jgi:hypothetical protein
LAKAFELVVKLIRPLKQTAIHKDLIHPTGEKLN